MRDKHSVKTRWGFRSVRVETHESDLEGHAGGTADTIKAYARPWRKTEQRDRGDLADDIRTATQLNYQSG